MCHPGSRSAGIIGRSWGPTTRRHRSNRRASCRCYRQQSRTCSAIVGSSEPARLCRLRKLAGSPTLSMLLASRRGAAGRVPARTTSSAWDTASRLQASARPHLHLLRADSSPRRVDKHRGWVGQNCQRPRMRGEQCWDTRAARRRGLSGATGCRRREARPVPPHRAGVPGRRRAAQAPRGGQAQQGDRPCALRGFRAGTVGQLPPDLPQPGRITGWRVPLFTLGAHQSRNGRE
jgi:hypothetical protein